MGGDDEIRILADTCNQMAARLKENVEKLEESNKRLEALNEELKQLDRMKSGLLANVSHELRTPLTAIKGYTDYILDSKLGPISEKLQKGLIVIQRNLERLSPSINALLDFSTMDVGRLSLNLQPFALPRRARRRYQGGERRGPRQHVPLLAADDDARSPAARSSGVSLRRRAG